MFYGVSYYPEHKTHDELRHDLDLLIKSGVNTVRMGEFAWCRFEPRDGEFCFDWLDEAVQRLGEAGIKTIICTPTACPPAWLVNAHPQMMYRDNRGFRRPFGGRRHYCYTNLVYREYSKRIAKKIGEQYGKSPYVAGFQIDNEPAQEVTGRCTCDACAASFRDYLKNKYKTIIEFNRRSGGIFWSQEYDSFEQINPPVNTIEVGGQQAINAFYENPTVRLEFERFSSDSQIEYQNIQTAALREYTSYPVTTNATGLATNSINNYDSTKKLDNYAFDYYPSLRDCAVDSFPYSFARGVKSGKPFWVLEFMSGGGHRLSGSGRVQPNPGALKQAIVQSFAHGAEMMMHFQFRSFPFGAEQLNYAIVDLDGVPRRRYYEMQSTAQLLKTLAPLEKAEFKNKAAICLSYDTHWAMRIKPANDPLFKYMDFCGNIYKQLALCGINADVISVDEALEKYSLVVLPSAFILQEKHRDRLKTFVKNGGVLLTTFLSSVKNEDNNGYTEPLPAGLDDLFGITVQEVEPVFASNITKMTLKANGKEHSCADMYWSELLEGSAEMLGQYTNTYKTGSAVISKNSYGEGTACYMGTYPGDDAFRQLARELCEKAQIGPNKVQADDKVEVVRRYLGNDEVYIVLNFENEDVAVKLSCPMTDYFDNTAFDDEAVVEGKGFKILINKN